MTDQPNDWRPESPQPPAHDAPPPAPPSSGGGMSRWAKLGIAVSALVGLLIVVGIVLALTSGADRGQNGEITEAGNLDVLELREGDCLKSLESDEETFTVPVVPCAQRHTGEVYALVRLSGDEFPGDSQVVEEAESRCGQRFPEEAGDAGLFYFTPTRDSWEQKDDRSIVCLVELEKPRSGRLVE